MILAYFGKRGIKFNTNNKFFKIEKQKPLGNTNKAVKDLNSAPSFNFVHNSMENYKRLGNFEDQSRVGGKASLVGEAAFIRPLQRRVFWPWLNIFFETDKLII
jgi:hypothetical protein